MTYPLRLRIFLNKGSPHLSSKSITICTCAGNQSLKLDFPKAWSWKWQRSPLMEIVSSLSHAVVSRLVSAQDALSNSTTDMYGNCTESKIPFYPIQNSFDIFNTQWEFQYPIKWKMCAYADQWVKKLTRVTQVYKTTCAPPKNSDQSALPRNLISLRLALYG